jgi:hypothetical protein
MERLIDQVFGILSRNKVEFQTRQDGREFRIPYDSAAVFLDFQQQGEEELVAIRSPLLQDVDESGPGREKLLGLVNDLNCRIMLGKACWYADRKVIELEHWLRGNDLQGAELMHALSLIARTAGAEDDALRDALGTGRTSREVMEAEAGEDDVVEA